MSWELALVAAAYVLGSLPSAWLMVLLVTGKDVRHEGSGNVGAANATRLGGLAVGVAVTLMDVAKGALPVWAMSILNPASGWLAATMLAAVAGHCFPVWLKFRGGKGVAATFGAFLVLAPSAALAAVALWVLVIAVSRRVSVASLVASAAFPVLLVLLDQTGPVILGAVSGVSILIIFLHRSNIRRLIDGSEPKIGGGGGT